MLQKESSKCLKKILQNHQDKISRSPTTRPVRMGWTDCVVRAWLHRNQKSIFSKGEKGSKNYMNTWMACNDLLLFSFFLWRFYFVMLQMVCRYVSPTSTCIFWMSRLIINGRRTSGLISSHIGLSVSWILSSFFCFLALTCILFWSAAISRMVIRRLVVTRMDEKKSTCSSFPCLLRTSTKFMQWSPIEI